MPKQTKPSIVFAHGLWADGSCFSKLIPSLQADGHDVSCYRGARTRRNRNLAKPAAEIPRHERLLSHRGGGWADLAQAKRHRAFRGRFA